MSRALCVTLLVAAHVLASAGDASAAPPAADRSAAAEDLFQHAKALFVKHDFAAACPLFLESYRVDPAGGTLQNLALCYEELGKWASAYARFQELRTLSKGDRPRPDRVKLADEHIAKLTPRLSRIAIAMPPEIEGSATLTLDGVTFQRPSWSAGILVDPGPHEIIVTAPGKEPFHTRVETPKEGAQQQVRVPALRDAPKPEPAVREPALPVRDEGQEERASLDTTGLVVGAVGAGALVAGGIFGVLTFTTNASAKERCSSSANRGDDFDAVGHCYTGSNAWKDANAMKDDARTFATVANVLVPVGIVGIGIGAYLVLRSGATRSTAIRLAPSLAGGRLEGTF